MGGRAMPSTDRDNDGIDNEADNCRMKRTETKPMVMKMVSEMHATTA